MTNLRTLTEFVSLRLYQIFSRAHFDIHSILAAPHVWSNGQFQHFIEKANSKDYSNGYGADQVEVMSKLIEEHMQMKGNFDNRQNSEQVEFIWQSALMKMIQNAIIELKTGSDHLK